MKPTKLLLVIDDISKRVSRADEIFGATEEKLIKQLAELREKYEGVDVSEKQMPIYEELKSRGEFIKSQFDGKQNPQKLIKEVNRLIKQMKAAVPDFQGRTNSLFSLYWAYMFMALIFLFLAPQFYSPLLVVVIIIPVFAGIRGIRGRSKSGLLVADLLATISVVTGLNWVKIGVEIGRNFSVEVGNTITTTGMSQGLAILSLVAFPILGGVVAILGVLVLILSFKDMDMFV